MRDNYTVGMVTDSIAKRPKYGDGNSTADRALTILLMFTEDRTHISANDVADHLGVSRATAYRYTQTLVRSDFLAEEPGTGFRLGVKVMELARIARRSYGLSEIALPHMRELASRSQETVLLTRRIGTTIVCLEREEWPGQFVRMSYERGSRLSLNAGASALVLLAWLPETYAREILDSQPLPQYTSATLTDTDGIIEHLTEIRERGYCLARGEVDPDAAGVAAPIFDAHGDVCAGLSVVTLSTRLQGQKLEDIAADLVDTAAKLSSEISVNAG